MKPIFLPREIMIIIKGYEYSLLYYEERQINQIKNKIRINVYQPYYLKGTKYHKSNEGQLYFIFNVLLDHTDYKFMSKDDITKYTISINNEASQQSW